MELLRACLFLSSCLVYPSTAAATTEGETWNGFVTNILSTLGVEQTVDVVSSSIKQSVRNAQRYNEKKFDQDWQTLSNELGPASIFNFVRNATFPSVVKSVHIVGGQVEKFHAKMMAFLLKKCDAYIGADAPVHPWNIMKQSRESVSFVLFVCATGFIVLFIQFYTIHNLILIVAGSFLMYSLGGPHWCFKCMLLFVAMCWYVFDLVMMYPFRFAVGVLVYFAASMLLSRFGRGERGHIITGTDLPELDFLSDRVQGVEAKTDIIQRKIDRLTHLIETMKDD